MQLKIIYIITITTCLVLLMLTVSDIFSEKTPSAGLVTLVGGVIGGIVARLYNRSLDAVSGEKSPPETPRGEEERRE